MQELIKTVFENEKIKVEEIESHGAVSPPDFWFDNPVPEWVTVTAGEAVLRLEDSEVVLKAGEDYYIEVHEKHRVEYTSADCKWLCVYIK